MPSAATADERKREQSSGDMMCGTAWYGARRERAKTDTEPERPEPSQRS